METTHLQNHSLEIGFYVGIRVQGLGIRVQGLSTRLPHLGLSL